MSSSRDRILKIAVPSPLRRLFDYLPPDDTPISQLSAGIRVRVPFGHRQVVGVIVSTATKSDIPAARLRKVIKVIDKEPVIDRRQLEFLHWASDYYQHPVGDVILNSMPKLLRLGKADSLSGTTIWSVTSTGTDYNSDLLANSPRQKTLFELLRNNPAGCTIDEINRQSVYSRSALKTLEQKGLVRQEIRTLDTAVHKPSLSEITPSDDQTGAIRSILASLNNYNCFLLNGVTGSGKTEIYIRVIRKVIENNRQALILLPEIALTPQFVQRLEDGIHVRIAVYHSGLSDRERLDTWIRGRDNRVQVILGTRSAIWIPLHSPGIIIVDEEHDLSYKQQESFRYSARDLALVRAKNSQCPVILGSATPSLESIHNLTRKDYQQIQLSRRVSDACMPEIRILDMKTSVLNGALSESLHQRISETLDKNQQVLIFQNRRGYAPAYMCHDCGWLAECGRCNKLMTLHKQKQLLWCHHCDRQISLPPECPECSGKQLIEIGHGTERIEETLKASYPDANIVRIDRDTTRRKGSMARMNEEILSGKTDILIGTQMLAKGHHFPAVTLAAIVDVDNCLYSTDFRATERMGQLITQVSGRAGRGKHPGTVLIQTHYPDHPLLLTLLKDGYMRFCSALLAERRAADLPPYTYMAMLRAEANRAQDAETFLSAAKTIARNRRQAPDMLGPVIAPMRRKSGRYRMQLILQSNNRQTLNHFLTPWLQEVETSKYARKVRWSIDVDPQDMM